MVDGSDKNVVASLLAIFSILSFCGASNMEFSDLTSGTMVYDKITRSLSAIPK